MPSSDYVTSKCNLLLNPDTVGSKCAKSKFAENLYTSCTYDLCVSLDISGSVEKPVLINGCSFLDRLVSYCQSSVDNEETRIYPHDSVFQSLCSKLS